jgi:hypothetical protein
MRTVYRVTVAAVNYDDEGNFVADETLFEATHHRAEALLRFAPGEVEVVLEEIALAGSPQRVEPDVNASVEQAPAAGNAQPVDAPAAAPKTRKRRTRAEIEAEKVREAAEADPQRELKDAVAAGVPVEAPQAPVEPEPVTPAAPVTPPEPVPAEVGATPASTPLTPTAAPEAPWNPFQQR